MITKRLLTPLFVLLTLVSAPSFATELVLAQVSDRPKQDFKHLRPILDLMVDKLRSAGVSGGHVELYPDLRSLQEAFAEGEINWITETPYAAAALVQQNGAIPTLRKWKNGQEVYQSLIFVRSDSPIKSLADLGGKNIALEQPSSFSSFYLPKVLLEKTGLTLEGRSRSKQTTQPNSVTYRLGRNEENIALWVDKGITEAGALNDGDWLDPQRVPTVIRERMRIISRSAFYPRAYELLSPKMPAQIRSALSEQLNALAKGPESAILMRYEHTTRFSAITDQDVEFLRTLPLE